MMGVLFPIIEALFKGERGYYEQLYGTASCPRYVSWTVGCYLHIRRPYSRFDRKFIITSMDGGVIETRRIIHPVRWLKRPTHPAVIRWREEQS